MSTGLFLAIRFLTRLPTPPVRADEADFAASMRWFPAAGLAIGACLAAAGWVGGLVDPWVGALAVLVAWVWITGALHLDGLADIHDAFGAVHKGPDRLRAVLADPHVGSFGVVAIVLQLMAKLVLLYALLKHDGGALALLLIPFAARIGPLLWTRWLPPLHAGLGARFRGAVRPVDLALWMLALAVAAWFLPALLCAPIGMALWGWRLRRTLGGISGDGHGAGIELVETGLLLAVLVMSAAR
ncbi:MAG: adenosylcobinamide-GDP ribazoletransferase [Sphingobium sp.]